MAEKKKRNWHPIFEEAPPRRLLPLDQPAPRGSGRCIAIASQKGGVGKTTTAVNLAAGFGLCGWKTLLMDLDLQANATSGVGLEKAADGIAGSSPIEVRKADGDYPYLESIQDEASLLRTIRETDFQNLWAFPSSPDLASSEMVRILQGKKFAEWKNAAAILKRLFDIILIDCPPSLGGIPTLALSISDGVIIPVQCEYYAMEGLSQILPVVGGVQRSAKPDLVVEGLLLTMYSNELDLSHEVVAEIQGYFPDLVYRAIIPRDVTLAESASHGMPIFYYEPLSRGAWSYIDLTREVSRHERT